MTKGLLSEGRGRKETKRMPKTSLGISITSSHTEIPGIDTTKLILRTDTMPVIGASLTVPLAHGGYIRPSFLLQVDRRFIDTCHLIREGEVTGWRW